MDKKAFHMKMASDKMRSNYMRSIKLASCWGNWGWGPRVMWPFNKLATRQDTRKSQAT